MGNAFTNKSPEDWPGDPTHQPAGDHELEQLHAWADAQLAHASAHTANALVAANSSQGSATLNEDEAASAAAEAARCQSEALWSRGFKVQLQGTLGMGAGLYATKAVAPGELYLRLPHACLLTAAAARHPMSSIGASLRGVEANGPPLDEITLLALFLLAERGRGHNSPWSAYLDTLPAENSFKDMPFYWAEEDLVELAGHPIVQDIRDLRESVAFGWRNLEQRVLQTHRHLFPRSIYNPTAWRWVFHLWQTRCIFVHVPLMPPVGRPAPPASDTEVPETASPSIRNGAKVEVRVEAGGDTRATTNTGAEVGSRRPVLPPIAMSITADQDPSSSSSTNASVNHTCPPRVRPTSSHWAWVPFVDMTNCQYLPSQAASYTAYDAATDAVVMPATQNYGPGDQVFENYGWTNHAYLVSHGFFLRGNSHGDDKLLLPPLILAAAVAQSSAKHALLAALFAPIMDDEEGSVDGDDDVVAGVEGSSSAAGAATAGNSGGGGVLPSQWTPSVGPSRYGPDPFTLAVVLVVDCLQDRVSSNDGSSSDSNDSSSGNRSSGSSSNETNRNGESKTALDLDCDASSFAAKVGLAGCRASVQPSSVNAKARAELLAAVSALHSTNNDSCSTSKSDRSDCGSKISGSSNGKVSFDGRYRSMALHALARRVAAASALLPGGSADDDDALLNADFRHRNTAAAEGSTASAAAASANENTTAVPLSQSPGAVAPAGRGAAAAGKGSHRPLRCHQRMAIEFRCSQKHLAKALVARCLQAADAADADASASSAAVDADASAVADSARQDREDTAVTERTGRAALAARNAEHAVLAAAAAEDELRAEAAAAAQTRREAEASLLNTQHTWPAV